MPSQTRCASSAGAAASASDRSPGATASATSRASASVRAQRAAGRPMPGWRDATGFDRATAERWLGWVRATLWPYFRPQVIGAEHLPRGRAGRALIIGCHSGVIPYDAACTLVAIHEATGRFSRAIGDNLFGRIGVVQDFLRRQGAVVGRPDVVEALLRAGHMVLVFPGGALDMERPYLTPALSGAAAPRLRAWARRLHQARPAHAHADRAARRRRRGGSARHARQPAAFAQDLVGFPFFPLLLFPVPLPVKLYIRFGAPIVLPGTPGGRRRSAAGRSAQHHGAAPGAAPDRRHATAPARRDPQRVPRRRRAGGPGAAMSALAEPAAAAPMRRASIEFARTADDWDLALHHYPGTRTDLPPVILCSGYACNRHFVDFDERYSLARFLARRGFDAWVLELRGHGYSEPAGGRGRGGRPRGGGRSTIWSASTCRPRLRTCARAATAGAQCGSGTAWAAWWCTPRSARPPRCTTRSPAW